MGNFLHEKGKAIYIEILTNLKGKHKLRQIQKKMVYILPPNLTASPSLSTGQKRRPGRRFKFMALVNYVTSLQSS